MPGRRQRVGRSGQVRSGGRFGDDRDNGCLPATAAWICLRVGTKGEALHCGHRLGVRVRICTLARGASRMGDEDRWGDGGRQFSGVGFGQKARGGSRTCAFRQDRSLAWRVREYAARRVVGPQPAVSVVFRGVLIGEPRTKGEHRRWRGHKAAEASFCGGPAQGLSAVICQSRRPRGHVDGWPD